MLKKELFRFSFSGKRSKVKGQKTKDRNPELFKWSLRLLDLLTFLLLGNETQKRFIHHTKNGISTSYLLRFISCNNLKKINTGGLMVADFSIKGVIFKQCNKIKSVPQSDTTATYQ